MALCASGILLSALVLLVILNDIISYKITYMIQHSILGAIACALFFTLCNYGLEIVNWALLALVPIFLFIRWVYTPPPNYNESMNDECSSCETCGETCDETCGCSTNKVTTYEIDIEKKKPEMCKTTLVKYNKSKIFEF
jgi:hypothetical protein